MILDQLGGGLHFTNLVTRVLLAFSAIGKRRLHQESDRYWQLAYFLRAKSVGLALLRASALRQVPQPPAGVSPMLRFTILSPVGLAGVATDRGRRSKFPDADNPTATHFQFVPESSVPLVFWIQFKSQGRAAAWDGGHGTLCGRFRA